MKLHGTGWRKTRISGGLRFDNTRISINKAIQSSTERRIVWRSAELRAAANRWPFLSLSGS